jgi:hypothetical protein
MKLSTNKKIKGVTPCVTISGNCSKGLLIENPPCFMIIQNSKIEKDLGIGRGWAYPSLSSGECLISGLMFDV